MILEAPSSLLVPVNSQAVFECKLHCPAECTVRWFFGGEHQSAVGNNSPGFVINNTHQENGTQTSRILTNATADKNNTRLSCYVVLEERDGNSAQSDPAMLQVILRKLFNACILLYSCQRFIYVPIVL